MFGFWKEEERRRKAEAAKQAAPRNAQNRKKDARDPKAAKEPVEVDSEDEVGTFHPLVF